MLEPVEKKILLELQRNGRISNVDLSKTIGLSESACFRRVKLLEESGVVKGYTAHLNEKKLGLGVTAFVQVQLDQRSEAITKKFMNAVNAEKNIVECYSVSGSFDYLLKVIAKDIDDYSDIVLRRILRFPGVKDVSSGFVLEEIKRTNLLPL